MIRTSASVRGRRRPRVMFVIGGLGTGGSERQLVELVVRTHGNVLDAVVMTLDDETSAMHTSRLGDAGIQHYSLRHGGTRILRASVVPARANKVVRRARPDLIYAWLEHASLYLAPIARLHGLPLLVARRNICGATSERFLPIRVAIRAAERSAVLVTVNSRASLLEARRRGIAASRIVVVNNGHRPADPLPFPRDPPIRIGYLAAFRPEKGHRRLLDVLGRIRSRHQWCVDLGGEGPLTEAIVEEARSRGLLERLHFAGPVADPREFWGDQHVALLLSDTEGSPNALIEAAFAGRPIVATATGGTPEVVAPDGGFLVSLDDYVGAARRIETLLHDATLRTQLGHSAHRQAAERFGMASFVDGHVAVIRRALGRGE